MPPRRAKTSPVRYAVVRTSDGAYLADIDSVPWTWTRDLGLAGVWRFTSVTAARRAIDRRVGLKAQLLDGLIEVRAVR